MGNIINPYQFGSPLLPLQALVAPSGFDPNAQELNIHKVFSNYLPANPTAKLIYSVGATTTTTLAVISGRSYYYGQEVSGIMVYSTIASGTLTWTVGSIKRHVIVLDSNNGLELLPVGAIWVIFGSRCTYLSSSASTIIKYIHIISPNILIPNDAFSACSGLTGVLIIPDSVTTIGRNAFSACSGLTGALIIPNSVTTIGDQVFQSCSGLTSLTLPNSITSIGNYIFWNCTGLTGTLTIPNSVTIINDQAFRSCSKLTGALIIPNSVTTIGAQVFQSCSGFTSLTIPSSVTTIGANTFLSCSGLTLIKSYRPTPATLGGVNVFGSINKTTCILHVPVGSLAAYRGAAQWTDFVNIIEDL